MNDEIMTAYANIMTLYEQNEVYERLKTLPSHNEAHRTAKDWIRERRVNAIHKQYQKLKRQL